ncbi:MAG: exodeoxyribonuclease VII small subunit [Coriobacteriales bacterium]|jgi:exodeoxyribonuclease VII small subunit|nr:exodeoxyribonuclease VII small subunit [Coriobacteriales bacterium]
MELEKLSYLEASEKLEITLRSLESDQLELEESLALYEDGVVLIRELQKRLGQAQQKVDVLMGELESESSDSVDTGLS